MGLRPWERRRNVDTVLQTISGIVNIFLGPDLQGVAFGLRKCAYDFCRRAEDYGAIWNFGPRSYEGVGADQALAPDH